MKKKNKFSADKALTVLGAVATIVECSIEVIKMFNKKKKK